jgi:fibronectin-binding autotransporter adhesin
LANGGTASGIGSSSNSAGNLIIDGGALKYIGAGNSTDRLFTLTQNGSILDASGTGAVILSNTGSVAFSGSGARTLTLTGTNIGNNTLAASIGDGSGGATSLVKSGTGTWILTGTSAYTGATTISNGILEVGILQNGGTASGIGSSSNSAGNLIIDGGALKYIGAGNSTNRHFTLTQNNGALDASGAGAVSFSSSSSVAFSGSGARTLTLTGTNTGNNTLAASIGDGSGGATSLVKSGTGTWILTGSNGYTGNTLIGGGTLVTKKSASLPGYNAPGKVTVNEGGTIAVRAGASTGEWADWEIDALRIHAVFNSGSFLGIDTTSNNFSYNSAIGGSLGLTKLGSNTLTLTASNTYTGGTIINAGTLRLSGGYDRLSTIGAITITGGVLDIDLYTHQQTSGDVSFQGGTVQNGTIIKSGAPYDGRAGTISAILAGSAGLTKTTTGTLTLTGTNSYSGGTTIMDGMLQLSGGDDRLSTSGAITISGGVLDLSGYSQTTFGAVSIQGGTVQNGTLITSGADFNGQTGTVSMALAGSVGLTKTTTGTLTLIASNTYSGGTTISGGTLEAGILNNGGMASGIGSSPNGASNLIIDGGTLKYIGAGNSTDRLFTLTQNGGALDASGAGAVNFTSTGSELSYGSGARTITLTGTNTSNNTLAASIGDGSGGSGGSVKSTTFLDEPTTSLVKSGSGTWVITGTNSYSGGTTIMDGTLQLSGGDDRLSTTGAIMIYGGVFDLCGNIQHTSAVVIFGRELDLGGTGQHPYGSTIFQGGDSPDNGSKIVNNGADYDGRCGTIGTDLEGAAGLAKTTGGTLTLYCSTGNSYVGVTTVRDGILIVSMLANGGLNSGLGASSSAASNLVLNGGTLKYTGGAVSTDRRFQLGLGATAGTLDASGTGAVNWTYNGPMEFYGSETILRTLTLTGTNTDDNTLAASIRNPSANTTSLTKTGTGAWILSGSNTYTGATTISGGTLELASTGQISTASAIINDATFQILGGTHAVGNITGAGTTKVIDNGILTVNSITQNTLQIGAGSLLTIAPIGGGPLADVGTMTAVPEPSTWAMLILAAMGGLEIYRRRRLCAAVAGDDQESFPHPPA